MVEASLAVVDARSLLTLFGPRDQHLKRVRDALRVSVWAQNDQIRIEGPSPAVATATAVFERLSDLVKRHGALTEDEVAEVLAAVAGVKPRFEAPAIEVFHTGAKIVPRTAGQAAYVKAVLEHDLTFCIGPAGCGKTYLAVALAVAALKQERVKKLCLVRPAVESGESLGYLPGDLQDKIKPYLRPLLDALGEMIDFEPLRRLQELGTIEMIPLAYMRGRTLNEAFIILDEAQNTTVAQMKMFLTRMGRGSKIVVAGDVTQIDLPPRTPSGLIDALERLDGIAGMAHVRLSGSDIVRHRLVHEIVKAYEQPTPRRRMES
jgi:phosphate starvation-inducible PhoH-like protein